MDRLQSFAPVIPDDPRVLIVGSMPGVKSLAEQQYYGNPRNHFWSIMFTLLEEKRVDNYQDKLSMLKRHGIALWDTIGSCYREGSLDVNIQDAEPNDIIGLVQDYPTIKLIGCNGTKAYDIFRKNFSLESFPNVDVVKLPSTSPIPGKYNKNLEEKIEAWKIIIDSNE
ncbi:DNA-deoxyinosine glycosylase [Oceanobacillus iheyensis]|uniref:Hypothetical conserved protein n=1 Tax=Oceanobacillus iheyensis (strain DSM 14371 / CIP 107618 / JCM 11309 / KCTC 3954 / HTE831) TaxID=221109 RepID=Q8CUP2_OCEIH|nr:DNA-deoxyinosine glycosylase [Oceanobacillus iheyensis]BAC13021.1 hypothetical conserved protein [Oceanobacillus iheyensis HTE831]